MDRIITPQQKQIVEKIDRQNKIEETEQNELRKQLGIGQAEKKKGDFYWEDEIGLTTKTISQNRDLSQYEKGGHVNCRKWMTKDKQSPQCNETAVRDFIWQMWSEKKLGYITISGDSVDSLSTSHIFIEPDKKGNFQIVRRTVRWSALPGANYWIQDDPKIISVVRVEDKPQKGQWTLILKDKSGKTSELF